jgi:hypothetical protein
MSSKNKVEELLKPRIKVIAPMPLMKNKVGEFLYRQEDDKGRFAFAISTGKESHFFRLEDFKLWPHIFHICEWWEERKIDEMPKYVKLMGKTTKVGRWFRGTVNEIGCDIYGQDEHTVRNKLSNSFSAAIVTPCESQTPEGICAL